ncbi:hypothetical protein LP419_06180 [Massilia sp. H-1]|nr:hypothetical protein LP419_06180 [Massilia sp. H-1]
MAALLEAMNIKLTETLREKLSLIYGGGMSGGINRVPKGQYLINLSLPTGPTQCGQGDRGRLCRNRARQGERSGQGGPEQGQAELDSGSPQVDARERLLDGPHAGIAAGRYRPGHHPRLREEGRGHHHQ